MDNRCSEEQVDEQIAVLSELADKLYSKIDDASYTTSPSVLAFIGAGPSKAANLPLSPELQNLICNVFVAKDVPEAAIHELLSDEVRAHEDIINSNKPLTLFEFAAVISKFAYGKKIIRKTIKESMTKPSHRPLSYELLSHLAKHRYIDHFIIINFDCLLDDSLKDELPERLKIIASPYDIPAEDIILDRQFCFAVHPFGILGEGSYSLTPEDVAKFGPDSIRKFIEKTLLKTTISKKDQALILLLIGYRAEEPAFLSFLRAQQDEWTRIHKQHRIIEVYVIDPSLGVINNLELLRVQGIVSSTKHIKLRADDAFELLTDLLRFKGESSGRRVWITPARHRILSKLFSYNQLTSKTDRFKIEILLQGLKSRGFVHLEAFGHIPRLNNYGDYRSSSVIQELIEKSILVPDEWQAPVKKLCKYVPNYMISNQDLIIEEFISLSNQRNINTINEWRIVKERDDSLHSEFRSISIREFLGREFNSIQQAPEIEIIRDVTPEVQWFFGTEAKALNSIDELTKKTENILQSALSIQGSTSLKIKGIWSTGEWLFHEDGWANYLGDILLNREDVSFEIVITRSGGVKGNRSFRRSKVLEKLLSPQKAKVEVRWLNWWELNRVLTLVLDKNGHSQAIYMRRRLSQPLVCPYFIDFNSKNALKYLHELWDIYWERAVAVEPGAEKI